MRTLRRQHLDTTGAEHILESFRTTYRLYIEHRDYIVRKLGGTQRFD